MAVLHIRVRAAAREWALHTRVWVAALILALHILHRKRYRVPTAFRIAYRRSCSRFVQAAVAEPCMSVQAVARVPARVLCTSVAAPAEGLALDTPEEVRAAAAELDTPEEVRAVALELCTPVQAAAPPLRVCRSYRKISDLHVLRRSNSDTLAY